MEKENKVVFWRQTIEVGGSTALTIPKELIEYLEIKNGDRIGMVGDSSRHGKFIGVWNETRQKQTKLPVTKKG